ncbi:MAG: glutamate decarboxylase [Bacillota bacterium]
MWTVVYIAPTREEAESVRDMLVSEGLLVKLRAENTGTGDSQLHEILVPEAEAEEAHKLLGGFDD